MSGVDAVDRGVEAGIGRVDAHHDDVLQRCSRGLQAMADRNQAGLGLHLDVAAHHLAGLHVERRRAGNEDEAVGLGDGRARNA
jgi:hypothetical protein